MKPLTKNQRFSHPILGGLASALLFSFLWRVIGDVATVIALVPMFTVSLRNKDVKLLAAALGIAALNVGLFLGLKQLVTYLLYVGAPGLILPRLAMQSRLQGRSKVYFPLERLSSFLGLYALGLTGVLMLLWYLGGSENLQTILESFSKMPLEAQENVQRFTAYIKLLWPYVPGLSVAVYLLMVVAATFLTQKWFDRNKVKFPRSALTLSELYLPWWCWKALAGFGLAWALSFQLEMLDVQHFLGNMTAPLVALFALQGLAIVTAYAKKQKNPKMILVIFYGFVVVFGWTLLILILAGLLEPWLDLRSRIQTKEKE